MVILLSVLLIHIGSVVYCVVAPDLYQSTMKLLVIPPAVSEGMVRSTANIEYKDRLKMLQQDILSGPRLLGVINEMGLFKEESRKMSSNALVSKVREADRYAGRREKFVYPVLPARESRGGHACHFPPRILLRGREHQEPRSDRPGNLEVSRGRGAGNTEKTRGAGGKTQAVQAPVRRRVAAAGAGEPEPAPETPGSDQEQLRRHRKARGPEGFPGGPDQQHREKCPGGRRSGSLANRRFRGQGVTTFPSLRTGSAEKKSWKSCP